jgi:hypothetical protein
MKLSLFHFLFLFVFIGFKTYSQENRDEITFLFYNVENLFDVEDNPETDDLEFTPEGDRHWTYSRLNKKLLNISKIIISAGGWEPPGIVALCEVENRKVLELLVEKTPLKSVSYEIIHKESPDHRGIDVAFLYNPKVFYPLKYEYFPLLTPKGKIVKTREILYVSGILNQQDTLHFFINHWPSRYSGLLETKSLRIQAAQLVCEKVNNLFNELTSPKIIIAGDFNDQPADESITEFLRAEKFSEEPADKKLYNLAYSWLGNGRGTIKYQAQWFVFDQIMVSGALLKSSRGFMTGLQNALVVNPPFLLEDDKKFGGKQPFSTYNGFTYQGGFSDHFPVLLKLKPTG